MAKSNFIEDLHTGATDGDIVNIIITWYSSYTLQQRALKAYKEY
jgi:hypothetical protein